MNELKQFVEERSEAVGGNAYTFKRAVANYLRPITLNYYITSKKTGKCIVGKRSLLGALAKELNSQDIDLYGTRNVASQSHIWSSGDWWVGRVKNNQTLWLADPTTNKAKLILGASGVSEDDRPPISFTKKLALDPDAYVWSINLRIPNFNLDHLTVDQVFNEAMHKNAQAIEIIRSKIPEMEDYCGGKLHVALKTGGSSNVVTAYPVFGLQKHMALFGTNLITRKITL